MQTETKIITANSVTKLDDTVVNQVLIAGSHGGCIAGYYAARSGARAVILNDAGVGKDHAGIAALKLLDEIGMAAATVARDTAAIGNGVGMLAGVISYTNQVASTLGIKQGQSCIEAAERLRHAPLPHGKLSPMQEGRYTLYPEQPGIPNIIGCDSVGLVTAEDQNQILIIGSHSALHGDASTALPVASHAAFFHDAGCRNQPDGLTRLPVLDERKIPAAAVDYRSARIGDACSMYLTGIISHLNDCAKYLGLEIGMPVQAATQELQKLAWRKRHHSNQLQKTSSQHLQSAAA